MGTFRCLSKTGSPLQTSADRDEGVMRLLLAGCTVNEVAAALRLQPHTVRRIRLRMCRQAETHVQFAWLKLWMADLRRAA
jgi:FixJ family two-component response regulator